MAPWKVFPTRGCSNRQYRRYLIFILLFSIVAAFVFPPIVSYKRKEGDNSVTKIHGQQLRIRENPWITQKTSNTQEQSFNLEETESQYFQKEPNIEIFVLPSSKGSLAVIEPLCYHRGSWILIGDSSINVRHSLPTNNVRKKDSLETLLRESKLPNVSVYSKFWLEEESSKGTISWFKRSVVIQLFDRSCTNIAHFAGRLMLYFHFLQNVDVYHSKESFASLFIRESELVQNLLTKSYQNHRKWQKQLIGTVLYNRKFPEDLFDYPSKYAVFTKLQHLNERDFYVEDSSDFLRISNTTICFEQVVLLGLLKGKFFSSPVGPTTSLNTTREGKYPIPTVPKDAIDFRKNWFQYWNLKPPRELQHTLIYMKREGKRRSFSNSSEAILNRFLEDMTKQYGYSYVSLKPDQLLVKENLQIFSSASIVLSLHGAHLTNCIFMAPCAVLVEIFPPRFTHDMYREGGNSGLKYFSWQLQNATPFPETPCTNPQKCKTLDEKRKVFYRDRANLTITQEDLQGIGNIIKKSVSYLAETRNELGKSCSLASPYSS